MKTIHENIKEQECRKKHLRSLLIHAVEDMQKPKRKAAKKQVKEAKEEMLKDIMIALRDKKRSIPKDWEKGFLCAMSIVDEFGEN